MLATYQSAILYRFDRSCACSSVDSEGQPHGRQGGNGQSVTSGKVRNALWIVALCQCDVGKAGCLVNGSSSAHLINLYQEPRLLLWFLRQHRRVNVFYFAQMFNLSL